MRARITAMAITLVAAGALLAPSVAGACPNEGKSPSKLSEDEARDAVLCLINEKRAARGKDGLNRDTRLKQAAHGHSAAMDKGNFFGHTSPGGSTTVSRVRRTGYLSGGGSWELAENLRWGSAGKGSPKSAVGQWLRSASHRRPLLSGRYEDIGIGVVRGSPAGGRGRNTAIYTVVFASRD